MPAPIVHFDIAGPADAGLAEFYRNIFDWHAGPMGTVTVPIIGPPLTGTLRTDPADKLIYIGVPDIAAALQQIATAGGGIVAPRFEVPGVVVLGLFTDPAGNSMGLIELGADGAVKVP